MGNCRDVVDERDADCGVLYGFSLSQPTFLVGGGWLIRHVALVGCRTFTCEGCGANVIPLSHGTRTGTLHMTTTFSWFSGGVSGWCTYESIMNWAND